MSQQAAASGHPTTFNTNVNRAKTKKWVEAKSYSYDGDDWGEVDDYDEYGGYDEPKPAPEPKPTGLRQRGQSASQMPQDPYSTRQDPYQSPVDTRIHGNVGGPPGRQQQQQYGSRSVTNPQPQPSGMRRMNSFDPEDERRAFSAGGPPQSIGHTGSGVQPPSQLNQSQNIAAHDFQSGQNYPDQRPQGQSGPARPSVQMSSRPSMDEGARSGDQSQQEPGKYPNIYPDQPRQSSTGGRTQSMASSNSALDFHNRRDFSPSAVPPPLQTRGSPSPHSRSSGHPPRKSSMSQDTTPALPSLAQNPPITGTGNADINSPSTRERATSGASKALPLIRPADIYRRMQEEKEKERQSQDFARPSMETLMGKSKERPDLPNSQDSEASQRLKPTLDPVTERRSEYGLERVDLNEPPKPEERRPTTSKKFELPKRKSTAGVQDASTSLQPMLPDVSRISGFGESFFGPASGSREPSQEALMSFAGPTASAPAEQERSRATPDKDLRNQPSLGFTSAVHEAFDRAEDQVPPTPSSAAGSTVGRSTSGGTSAVSPIISRGPSTSTENWSSKLPGIDDVTNPTKVDDHEGSNSRPMSSSSLGTPKQITRKPSPTSAMIPLSTDLPSPSFIPGHRRDLSTPSPDNSPAKTPTLEVNRHLRQPQEVELAAATPTDPSFSKTISPHMSNVAEQEPIPADPSEMALRGRSDLHVDTQPMAKSFSAKADPAGSPVRYPQNHLRTRTDSGSSNRVRDLADKFESGSRPGSAHSATPRSSVLGNNMQRDDLVPPRPLADRMESFRPHLPGGWESSASIAPAAPLRRPESTVTRTQPDSIATNSTPREDLAPPADQAPSSMSHIKDASEEAFTAVAAAGTALAGALAAAIGMDQHNGSEVATAEEPSDEHPDERRSQDSEAAIHPRNVSMNTVVNPEATKSYLPAPIEDEASTAAPTPLPKDAPLHRTNESESPDYFSSPKLQEVSGRVGRSEEKGPANRPSMLPSLSTDTETPQYESDRLRRDIVRELSPMNASEPTTAQSDYSNYEDPSRFSTNQSLPRPGYGSGVLYESYWNDANSDDDTSHLSGEPGRLEDATTARRQQGAAVVGEPLRPRQVEQDTSASEPLHSGPKQQDVSSDPTSVGDGPQLNPQVLQHRFSWEQPLQSPQPISADSETTHEAPIAPISDLSQPTNSAMVREAPDAPVTDFLRSAVYPEGRSFEPKDRPEASQLSILPKTEATLGNDDTRQFDQDASFPRGQNESDQHGEIASIEKESTGHVRGLEVAQSSSTEDYAGQMNSGYDHGPNHTGQYSPIVQSEQRREEESHLIEPSLSSPPVQEPSPTTGAQIHELPPLPPPNSQPKIAAFREILALKSPSERIRAYDETREQFANLNTGLAHWLAVTARELPEHADLFTDSARRPAFQGHKPSPSRSKLSGLLQSGGSSGQPYFNSPASVPNGALANTSSHGYSPSTGSSGKISSQQVQAKGKDLLHTAGVFGGKANVAAKGLFSKGKSKLRGSSGAEKAFPAPPQPYSPEPRGMQQEPSIGKQPTIQSARGTTQDLRVNSDRKAAHPNNSDSPQKDTFAIVKEFDPESATREVPYQHINPNKAPIQTSSQESQPLPQSSGQKSPRDTPSLESFTQSQEGDDERSEESAPTNLEHPPRASSLYLKGIANHRQSRSPQNSTTIGETAPNSVQERIVEGSQVGSPREVQTPRSATSNTQTPTQATFMDANQPAISAGSPDKHDGASILHHRGAGSSPSSFSQSHSRFPAHVSGKNRRSQEPGVAPRFSHDSEGINHTADSGNGLPETSSPTLQNRQNQRADVNPYAQAPVSMTLPHQSETSQEMFLQSRTNAQNRRPNSVLRDPVRSQTQSQDHSWRGPSIDSDLGHVNFDHPPSPLTPRQPTNQTAPDQRGRAGPIHYGIDHDFDRPGDTERSRSHSPSYSRLSQDSRPSLDPNILDHPAFRAVAEGNGMPAEDYRAHLTREENLTPRQQRAEHMLVGGGQTTGRRSESKSRSRRGSRSSAFFKAFTSPSKSDHPPLPNAPDSQASSSPRNSPAIGDRKSKRLSIFRPRSGNTGSESGDSRNKENMVPWNASPQDSFTQVANNVGPSATRRVEEEPSSKAVSNKLSKKLQRASTSVKPEPESGKKKRFSAIGTLFGGRKRQSSSLQSRVTPQQQSHPIQTQQRDSHGVVQPNMLDQYNRGPPREEQIQPPREGYYAPGLGSSNSGSRQNGQSYPRAPDAPAYVQDSALRVRQLMSPVEQPPNAGVPQTSATFPQRSPQHSSSGMPRSSTSNQTRPDEAFTQRPGHQSKASGSSWTRFSTHARSKSHQEPPQPPSTGAPSSPPPKPYVPTAAANTPATARRSFQGPLRSESPPPPPPPPKDDWHRPHPRDSSLSPPRTDQHARHHHHSPSPSQSSPGPARQSLPPLQTNVHARNAAIGSGRTMTPEEKRRSRQMEIEQGGMQLRSPAGAAAAGRAPRPGVRHVVEAEDEEPVMSATSFPGQMWQPSYAHWDE